jgi:hypothetical protein
MKKYLSMLALLGAGLTVAMQASAAPASDTPAPKAVKKAVKKEKTQKKAAAKPVEDNDLPDMAGQTRTDFNCELGNKISVYESGDDKRIGLRWNKKIHELTRVDTTTGAHRFENKDAGLVWINIPAKGMLLDSKKGQQLANDCKTKKTA